MITYFIKCVACSGLLLGVYALFLEKEKMHKFNRFYLLAAWVLSWIIPLITFKVQAQKVVEQVQNVLPATNNFVQTQSSEIVMNTAVQQTPADYLPIIIWSIYGIITLILLIRYVMNMVQIRRQISKNPVQKFDNYSLVLIPNNTVSFSFFDYIFPAESDYENGKMEHNIFLHEMVHAREKHSIDILLMELCKVFLWFNPLVFLYKQSIQLNHEFLADDVVVDENKNVFRYQSLLLSKITQIPISQLVSSSNYSITKKRFIMMTKKTNRIKSMCLKLSIIPIVGIMIFGFGKKVVASQNPLSTLGFSETIFANAAYPTNQDTSGNGISKQAFDEYQSKAQKALKVEKLKDGNKYTTIKLEDELHLHSIFKSMTKEQQEKAINLPPIPTLHDRYKFPHGNGISQADFDEYQDYARKSLIVVFFSKEKKSDIGVKIEDGAKLDSIFKLMSVEQQSSAIQAPPPPPPPIRKKLATPKVVRDEKNDGTGIITDGVKNKNILVAYAPKNKVTKNYGIYHEKGNGIILVTDNPIPQNERYSKTIDTTINGKGYHKVSVFYLNDSSKNSVKIITKDSASIFKTL